MPRRTPARHIPEENRWRSHGWGWNRGSRAEWIELCVWVGFQQGTWAGWAWACPPLHHVACQDPVKPTLAGVWE